MRYANSLYRATEPPTHPAPPAGLGTVPMHAPEVAATEVRRCVTELGLAGIQIGSHINSWTLAERALDPVWRAAEEVGAAVFVHPWDMMGSDIMKSYFLPWLVGMPAETSLAICSMMFGGVFERFPRLRVCFAHGGGSFPCTVGRIQHGFDVRPDLCAKDCAVSPRDQLGRFWTDSLVHDPAALDLAIEVFGTLCGCVCARAHAVVHALTPHTPRTRHTHMCRREQGVPGVRRAVCAGRGDAAGGRVPVRRRRAD